MIKILHTGDLHLDSPFDGLPEERAAQKRRELRETFLRICETAKAENADIMLISGDLFDSDRIYAETADMLQSAFTELSMPVFIAPGNHDPFKSGSFYKNVRLPENVHVFKSGVECIELPELGANIWGAGFEDTVSGSILEGFCNERGDRIEIMVLHGDPVNRDNPYNYITAGNIENCGMDYLALGHIHAFSGLLKQGETFYAWPGCPMGRGFDELGEKGIIVCEVEKGSCELKFVPMGAGKYESVSIDLSASDDPLADAIAVLPENAKNDIYRITFNGRITPAPDLDTIKAALENRFFELQLIDKTSPRRDIWEGLQENTLRGVFLSMMRKRFDEADDEEKRRIANAVRWGIAALNNGEEPV